MLDSPIEFYSENFKDLLKPYRLHERLWSFGELGKKENHGSHLQKGEKLRIENYVWVSFSSFCKKLEQIFEQFIST